MATDETNKNRTKRLKPSFGDHDVEYFRTGLTDKEFARLGQLIYAQSGIQITPKKKSMIEARLRKRLRVLEFKAFNEYLDYLFSSKGMKSELVNMIDVVTTNKTDFFREPAHFDFMTRTILPHLALVKKIGFTGRPFRVWSAGCSSGEEPYTIAMVLNEFAEENPGFDFEIVGTDLSTIVLDKCRQAIYKEEKVEPVPLVLKKKYLLRSRNKDEKTVRICSDLRSKVRFEHLNFMDDKFHFERPFDLIFCRNVIIYFDRPTQQTLLNKFMHHLNDESYLLMGHSETLHGMGLPLKQLLPATYQRI